MKYLSKLILFSLILAPTTWAREFNIQDLRAMDSTIDEQLIDAGYDEDPTDLVLVVSDEAGSDEAASKKDKLNFEIRTNQPGKNLWIAGAVVSSAYIKGVQLAYLRYNPKKDKIRYHIDLSGSGTHEFQNVALSYNPHIGRWGLFMGVSGQYIRIKSDLLPTSPATKIYGGGAQIGWQKTWGKRDRVITSVQYGASFYYHNLTYSMLREAKASVSVLLIRK